MIVNACGVLLSRRDWREADRLAVLYAENLGKVSVRFVGVNKPERKLKALSEPLVWGEYRLYLSPRSEFAKVIGGQIISTFPALRGDFNRTVAGLACGEMLSQLAPERAPHEAKYRLLCLALTALDADTSPWLEVAYGLKLLDLAGYGIRDIAVPGVERKLWHALHDLELSALDALPWRAETAQRLREVVYNHVEAHIGKALRCREFREQLRPQPEAVC